MKPGDVGIISQPHEYNSTGNMLTTHESRARVLVSDDQITFYDHWLNHLNAWGLHRRRTYAYLRHPTAWMMENTQWIDSEPLTKREQELHRADWPMEAFSFSNINWNSELLAEADSLTSFNEQLGNQVDEVMSLNEITAPEMALVGPNSGIGMRDTELISAQNGAAFTAVELLWQASRYVRRYNPVLPEKGIGLYRLGLKNKMPWYFIGSCKNPALP